MPDPAPTYDLSLSSNDFAAWKGLPRRSLVICSHPRSGSTMLGEAIHFTGGLGCPLEYFHRGFRPYFAARWNALDLDSYVAAAHRWRTDPSGVFSVKLFWQDVEELAHERAPDRFPAPNSTLPGDNKDELYRSYHALLTEFLPAPTLVSLTRCDIVRQAVSAAIATQTGRWRSIDDAGRNETEVAAHYDYDLILKMISLGRDSMDHWERYFKAVGDAPYRLSYEDMVRDYSGVIARLLESLGRPGEVPPRRMIKQWDSAAEAMILRFLRDHAARQG